MDTTINDLSSAIIGAAIEVHRIQLCAVVFTDVLTEDSQYRRRPMPPARNLSAERCARRFESSPY